MATTSVSSAPIPSVLNFERRLRRLTQRLGLLLARHPEDDEMAALYDDVLDKLHMAEAEQGV